VTAPIRRTRAEAREDTRRRVLEAALAVFSEKGFSAASVEEIAARAGFTRGALYSNFADKEALFLALVDERLTEREAEVSRVIGSSSPLTLIDDLREWRSGEGDDTGWVRLVAEFRAHALRNESARLRLAESEQTIRSAYARAIGVQFAALGLTPPAPDDLATLLAILDTATPIQRLIDPDGVREEFFFDILSLLSRAVVALAEATEGERTGEQSS
jgi:AcrR family transcriptional regulator